MNILIKNGRIIDPKNNIDAKQDLYIAAGQIVGIGKAPPTFSVNQTIDASGLIVAPGFVDLCARLREPGDEYKATLASELRAAAAGGVTSLSCPPDTDPVLDEPGLVEMLKLRAWRYNLARIYPLGALTQKLEGKTLTEMCELTEAGCAGFTQADHPIVDTQILWRALEYAATFGYTVFLRPEEPFLAKDGVAHDGEVAGRLGLKGIPSAAEALRVAAVLRIAQETKAKIHFCRISTAEGVALIRAAKKNGVSITADVSIHHLHLTEHDIGYFNTNAHLKPPLRTQRDKDALCLGVVDGTIDAICSDHAPVDEDAKLLPFALAEAGATGLELLLPLTLKWSANSKAPLSKAVAKITSEPAAILGIQSGNLSVGAHADIAIFDPEAAWQVTPNMLMSQGKNTPFINMELTGKVMYTLLNGEVTYQSTYQSNVQ
ncbi:MAG: dihydroorotase [Methylophilaceae bacterium]|nr:MAG: dihydroorotase [Methylophilaceae bacterium]